VTAAALVQSKAGAGTARPLPTAGVARQLFSEGFAFDFFQAVRIFERLTPDRTAVGREGPPGSEIIRFRSHVSLSFPASSIYEVQPPAVPDDPPGLTVTFLGLAGSSGVLPRHYTELILRLERDVRGPERYVLRDWLDLFNHRLISLFYRSWEKYRFWLAHERGEHKRDEPDTFTNALWSLVGLGMPPLRKRLRVRCWRQVAERRESRVLGSISDLALLYYGGHFARRIRTALGLESVLSDYFGLPVHIVQFSGQWLQLDRESQTCLGLPHGGRLGVDAVAGERVWDVESKLRIRLGPMTYKQFVEFLPDRERVPGRKSFYLLVQLARQYVGPERDFDVQLLLKGGEAPECVLTSADGEGTRLGWNSWLGSREFAAPVGDAVFQGLDSGWIT
jgi:type VI secretion system protein ImpH